MKYCTHCGAEIMDEAVMCTKCGCWLNQEQSKTAQQKTPFNPCALVGFILSMASIVTFFLDFLGLLALAGTVVSIVGLTQFRKNSEQRGKAMAIAGVAVGACFFVFGLALWIPVLI